MLNYIQNIGWVILWSFPFTFVLNLIRNLLEFPISKLGRIPVYILRTIVHYLLCMYYTVSVIMFCDFNELSGIPFLIITSFSVFMSIISQARDAADDQATAFFSISSVIFVIVHIVTYIKGLVAGGEVIASYFLLASKVLEIPLIGDILNFILPFIGVMLFFATILSFIVTILPLASVLAAKKDN